MASSVLSPTTFNCRKRNVSSCAYEEKFYDDSEVSFGCYPLPSKKIRIYPQFDDGVENASCHIVDEDITFKAANFPRVSPLLENKPLSQPVDEEITFKTTTGVDSVDRIQEFQPRRSPNGYILPDPLPKGLVLKDLRQQKWVLGTSVGIGGFGEIYSAAPLNSPSSNSYVIKVEPHSNGPLFVEAHYYLKAGSADMIEAFKKEKNLDHFGIPNLVGTGWFYFREKKFRFLVLPRFGESLQAILDSSKNVLSVASAANIAKQIVDCYEYIHSQGFVHKDVKGSNLLFSINGPSDGKVYLVDYGLVSSRFKNGLPKPFFPDERCACEGTLEFCSREAHLGCFSPRGDFEVLLYNLIDWLGGKLPWEQVPQLSSKEIEKLKQRAFLDKSTFLKNAFSSTNYPALVEDMMVRISEMKFDDTPDYKFFKNLFLEAAFTSPHGYEEVDNEVKMGLELRPKPLGSVKNSNSKEPYTAPSPKKRPGLRNSVETSDEPEELDEECTNYRFDYTVFSAKLNSIEEQWCRESMKNPTPMMLEISKKIKDRAFERQNSKNKQTPRGRKFSGQNCRSPASLVKQEDTSVASSVYHVTRRGTSVEAPLGKRIEKAVGGLGMKKLLSAVSKTFFSFASMHNKL